MAVSLAFYERGNKKGEYIVFSQYNCPSLEAGVKAGQRFHAFCSLVKPDYAGYTLKQDGKTIVRVKVKKGGDNQQTSICLTIAIL